MANPKKWPMGTISDLAASIQYGTSKKSAGVGEFPYIRMGNITYEGGWDFSDMKYIDLTEDERSRYLVHSGEVLFNRTNSRDLVGKTAVFRKPQSMAYAGYLVKLVANMHQIEASFTGGREPNYQYIVTTTEPPPTALQEEPWLRLVLDASTPEGRLLGVDL